MNRTGILGWLFSLGGLNRRRPLQCVFYYEFLGLGGVETVLLNRLAAFRSAGIDAQFWFSRLWGDGASYLASADGIRRVCKEDVGTECAAAGIENIVVIDNSIVLRDVLDHCPRAAVFFESHASKGPHLARFHAAVHDPRLAGCLVPSEYNAELLMEESGFRDRARIHIIRNGLDLSMWSNGGEHLRKDQLRPTVLWIGRLETTKDPVTAVRCAAVCAVRVPDVQFILVGNSEDSYAETVTDIVARSGVPATNVEFVPHVPYHRMPELYAAAALSGGALLSTSLAESSPMAMLEAMASGCPVVASAVGGVPTLLSDSRNGCLFKTGDVSRAVDAIVRLHRDRRFRGTVVEQARQYVVAHHSASAAVESFRRLLSR